MSFPTGQDLAARCSPRTLLVCSPNSQGLKANNQSSTLSLGTFSRSSLNSSSFPATPKTNSWKNGWMRRDPTCPRWHQRQRERSRQQQRQWQQVIGWERSHLSQLKPLVVLRIHLKPGCKQWKGVNMSVDSGKLNCSRSSFSMRLKVQSVGEWHQGNKT